MRLNRFLAVAGLGSRRGVEELITQGSVRVNGQVVTNLATQILPTDSVKVGSRLIRAEQPIYAVLHKPPGYVCTADDEFERRTIFELLPPNWPRVHHVGRLDLESEGLIFVTNDGDLTHTLTHPSHEVEKEYDVLLDRPFAPDDRAKLLKGFRIEHGYAKCEGVETIKADRLRLILTQGLKRQIRLMLYKLGYEVKRLFRIRIGPILIEGLARGAWRFLSQKEVTALRDAKPKSKPKAAIKPHTPAAKIHETPRGPEAPKKSATSYKPVATANPAGRKKTAAWSKAPGAGRFSKPNGPARRPRSPKRRD